MQPVQAQFSAWCLWFVLLPSRILLSFHQEKSCRNPWQLSELSSLLIPLSSPWKAESYNIGKLMNIQKLFRSSLVHLVTYCFLFRVFSRNEICRCILGCFSSAWSFHLILLSAKHSNAEIVHQSVHYIIENVSALHLPVLLRGLPQPYWKTDRETPTQEYIEHRKVCQRRYTYLHDTLRRVYTTPRGNHPCIVLVQYSIVVVSKYKNKAT